MHITTGRRLAAGFPADLDSVLVMLDAGLACRDFQDPDLYIHWGAYLGTADEVLLSGRLVDVAAEIDRTKQELRSRHGWIMDTYLLQRLRRASTDSVCRVLTDACRCDSQPLTVGSAMTSWTFDPLAVLVIAAAAFCYLRAVRRLRRQGGEWPVARSVIFGVGLLTIAVVTLWWVGAYAHTLFWVYTVQIMVLLVVSPALLMFGRPVTLARAVRPPGYPAWVARLADSRPDEVAVQAGGRAGAAARDDPPGLLHGDLSGVAVQLRRLPAGSCCSCWSPGW